MHNPVNRIDSPLMTDDDPLDVSAVQPDQSGKGFKELADLLPEIIYRTDRDGNITFVNNAGYEFYGFEPLDLPGGLKPECFFVPEDGKRLRDNLNRCLAGLVTEPSEYRALKRDGKHFPVLVHGRPVFDRSRCIGSIGVIIDLSYRKKIEEKLQEAEDKYRDIFENVSDAWYFHDLEGNFIETNFALKKELNVTEEELNGLNVRDIVPERYRHEFERYIQDVLKKGSSSGVMSVIIKDGSRRIYEYRNSLVQGEEGPIGVRGSARDITDRIKVQIALKASEERYRSVFENAGLPMIIIEDSMLVSMMNARFEEMTGYAKAEVQGRMKFADFIAGEDRARMMENFLNCKTLTPAEYECRIHHLCGEKYDVIIRLGSIPKTKQHIASFTDITSRKQQEEALRESQEHLHKENILLRSSIKERYRFGEIIGKSPAMQEVYEFIIKAATANTSVIIYGESGTGKELVARAVHQMSDRKDKRFVTVNCGAIPENILESEFFGYMKGAFTGADANKQGYLDYANGGTLFLDEVGEIGLNMQVKLLRAIEGGGFIPVGCAQVRKSDVRIIAATNRNLKDLLKNGAMREDFFYRIHILPIRLPPLRERKEDLPLLVEHFLQTSEKPFPPLPGKVMEALKNYNWPGNVRELQNVLHRYFTLKKIDFMDLSACNDDDHDCLPSVGGMETMDIQAAMDTMEQEFILKALQRHQWHRGRAADELKINRKTLFTKMKKYGLIKP